MKSPGVIRSGFTLVEVSLSVAILAFCLLPLVGLLPIGLNSNQSAVEATGATNVAAAIAADLRLTPVSSGTSGRFGFSLPSAGTAKACGQTVYFSATGEATGIAGVPAITGALAITGAMSQSRYRATVDIIPPEKGATDSVAKRATMARVLITWPAAADPNPGRAPKNYLGSIEVITALDRN